MVLYGFGGPSRATRVAWALEEVGAAWSYVATSPRAPEVLALHPLGKLPVLVDGDLVLTESLACVTWVADRHPDAELVPAVGTPDRATYLQWASFVVSDLEQPLWLLAKHRRILPDELRADVGPAAQWEFGRAAGYLATRLGDREFLVGDRFSAADLLAVHTLGWALASRVELPESLIAYAKHHRARPALARAHAREADASA